MLEGSKKAAKKIDAKNKDSAPVVADPVISEEVKVEKAVEMTGKQSPVKSPKKPFGGGVSSASGVELNDDNFSEEEDSPDGKKSTDGMNAGSPTQA